MPNHSGAPNTGAKSSRPSRINSPHCPRNMEVEKAHMFFAFEASLEAKVMLYGMEANTTAISTVE